jgi:hypothetical protein
MAALERIENPAGAEAKVLRDVREIVLKLRRLSERDVKDVCDGIARIREIRSSVYEDLNQILHECLLLRSVTWLLANGFDSNVMWEWNPRQTGSANEPDIRGSVNGRVLVSVEASTSETPQGILDSRMRNTLRKLSQMDGKKFYFVSTDEMARRAETKKCKAGWPIKVVKL